MLWNERSKLENAGKRCNFSKFLDSIKFYHDYTGYLFSFRSHFWIDFFGFWTSFWRLFDSKNRFFYSFFPSIFLTLFWIIFLKNLKFLGRPSSSFNSQKIAIEVIVKPCLKSTWRNFEMYLSVLRLALCNLPSGIAYSLLFIFYDLLFFVFFDRAESPLWGGSGGALAPPGNHV